MPPDLLWIQDFTKRADGPGRLRTGAPIRFAAGEARLRRRGEAMAGAGLERKCNRAVGVLFDLRCGLAQQVHKGLRQEVRDAHPSVAAEREGVRLFDISVDQHQRDVLTVGRNALQRQDGGLRRTQSRQLCAVEKAGMFCQQFVQLSQFGNEVFFVAPRQAAAAVDQDSFGGEPFDAAGEPKRAVCAGESAEPVTQQRPRAPFFRQSVVVVGFAVVRQQADPPALFVRMVQIAGDLPAGDFLEQFGIGPLHPAFRQQSFRFVPTPAQALEQKERLRKFLAYVGGDVLPDRQGDFVTGVATKSVNAAPAPGKKGRREFIP